MLIFFIHSAYSVCFSQTKPLQFFDQDSTKTMSSIPCIDGSFCTSLDNDPNNAWCYIDKDRETWEYCDIPLCQQDLISDPPDCLNENDKLGVNYIGKRSVTKSKIVCQAWNSSTEVTLKF